MGNSQSSENGSGGSGGNTWEYTPSNGGNGTTSDAVWQGAKQGWNEFWKNPSKGPATLGSLHLGLTTNL